MTRIGRGRLALATALIVASAATVPGCGGGAEGGAAPMVADPAPLPREETTEYLLQQRARAKHVRPSRANPARR